MTFDEQVDNAISLVMARLLEKSNKEKERLKGWL
jgi:hypothetical protein